VGNDEQWKTERLNKGFLTLKIIASNLKYSGEPPFRFLAETDFVRNGVRSVREKQNEFFQTLKGARYLPSP